MPPSKEISPPSTPLVSDGEIPAVYPTKLKNPLQASVYNEVSNGAPEVEASRAEATNGHNLKSQPVSFNPQYALKPRKLRIITIGAGFSGLLIAHKFQHRFPELQEFVDHTIFESRSDIGGTWLVNTYPGVQCDVPSHIYVS
jgi:hypothetical protein